MVRKLREPRLLAASILAVATMGAVMFAVVWRAQDQAAFDRAVQNTCRQVNVINAAHRAEAHEAYRNLDRNARLLGIKVTPELRTAAREGLKAKLRRFAPLTC